MTGAVHSTNTRNMKRKLTLSISFLLILFLGLLIAAIIAATVHNKAAEKENLLLNIVGQQRLLTYQYSSQVNHLLVGLASSNLEMVLSKKKDLDSTTEMFEEIHDVLLNGGRIELTSENHFDNAVITPIESQTLRDHLDGVYQQWQKLKRLSLLSLRSDSYSISKNPYFNRTWYT